MMYEELLKSLRICADGEHCDQCTKWSIKQNGVRNACEYQICTEAADAIEEILKVAKAMHTWIFLNSVDEQDAYDECGLTDEMNAEFGYGGQFKIIKTSKDKEK